MTKIKSENWTSLELFNYLINVGIFSSEENFKDWANIKKEMISMVEEDMIINNLNEL